jgi:hypothetical protein
MTSSPSTQMSSTFATRRSASSEMWSKPSVPGKISTNAPKSVTFLTLPT